MSFRRVASALAIVIGTLVVLTVSEPPVGAQRLPETATPEHYDLAFVVDIPRQRFDGTETIRVQVSQPTRRIVLNAAELTFRDVSISATGAGIFVPAHLEGCSLKNPVKLVIELPDCEPFRARGRIVHRTKIGREFLGVEFMNLTEDQIAQISRYVEKCLRERPQRQRQVEVLAS